MNRIAKFFVALALSLLALLSAWAPHTFWGVSTPLAIAIGLAVTLAGFFILVYLDKPACGKRIIGEILECLGLIAMIIYGVTIMAFIVQMVAMANLGCIGLAVFPFLAFNGELWHILFVPCIYFSFLVFNGNTRVVVWVMRHTLDA